MAVTSMLQQPNHMDLTTKYGGTKQNFSYLQNQELFEHDELFIPTVKIGHTQYKRNQFIKNPKIMEEPFTADINPLDSDYAKTNLNLRKIKVP
jgi:hypothetical protein